MNQHLTEAMRLVSTGHLSVDNQGRIWRNVLYRKPTKPRRAETTGQTAGYLRVRLSTNGNRSHVRAHQIVWTHFNGPIPDGLVIDHKNGDKTDNRPENLDVVTHGENVRRRGPCKRKLSKDDAATIRWAASGGLPIRVLAKDYGVSYELARRIVKGTAWAKATRVGSGV